MQNLTLNDFYDAEKENVKMWFAGGIWTDDGNVQRRKQSTELTP